VHDNEKKGESQISKEPGRPSVNIEMKTFRLVAQQRGEIYDDPREEDGKKRRRRLRWEGSSPV